MSKINESASYIVKKYHTLFLPKVKTNSKAEELEKKQFFQDIDIIISMLGKIELEILKKK